jgi:hypothetical protein
MCNAKDFFAFYCLGSQLCFTVVTKREREREVRRYLLLPNEVGRRTDTTRDQRGGKMPSSCSSFLDNKSTAMLPINSIAPLATPLHIEDVHLSLSSCDKEELTLRLPWLERLCM